MTDYELFQEKINYIFHKYENKKAITFMKNSNEKQYISFGEMRHIINNFRNILDKYRIWEGDRIVLLTPHSPYGIITGMSAAYHHVTIVLIDASLPREEICRLIDISDSRAIFTTLQYAEIIKEHIKQEMPVFKIDNDDFTYPVIEGFSDLIQKTNTIDPDKDVIAILFSSGTTSSMKGIMITYHSVLEARDIFADLSGLTPDMSYLLVLPFNHIAGFTGAMTYLLTGCSLGLIEDVNASKLQKGLLDFEPSYFAMVPKVYEVMEEKIRASVRQKGKFVEILFNFGLFFCGFLRKNFGIKIGRKIFDPIISSVFGKQIFGIGTGAGPCRKSTAEFFINMGIEWANLYATTEAGVPIAATGIHDRYPVGTVGNVKRDKRISVRINNPNTEGIGEIQVKSELLMKGYFREPNLTKCAFDDGYFKTGDLGYIDKKGYLYVTGRMKEIILLQNGKKVSPVDIDNIYQQVVPDGCIVASCGIQAENESYDNIWVFVEKTEKCKYSNEEITSIIQKKSLETSSLYKIHKIRFIDKIPMTSVGKVRRFLLKNMLEENNDSELNVYNNTDTTTIDINQYPRKIKWFHKLIFLFFRMLSKIIWKFEVKGLENIPTKGKFLICPNHQSHLDGLWIWTAMGRKFPGSDNICCMAKKEHLLNKKSAFWMNILGAIPVDRKGNTIPAIRRSEHCLQNTKKCFLIHPEGTRTRDGKIHTFKGGAALISIDTGYPIVPVKITGAYDIFPYMRKTPKWFDIAHGKRYKIQIEFLSPLYPSGETKESLTEKLYISVTGKNINLKGKTTSLVLQKVNEETEVQDSNLKAIIQKYSVDRKIYLNSRLKEDLNIDSLEIFEIVCEIENAYQITIADNMESVKTYHDLQNIILKLKGGNVECKQRIRQRAYPQFRSANDLWQLRKLISISDFIYPMEVCGLENIIFNDNYIFCANHASYFDPLWMMASLEQKIGLKDIFCMAAVHTKDGVVSGKLFKLMGGIPVDRDGNTVPAMEKAIEVLQNGKNLIIFPEGARSRDGSMLSFKSGAGWLAKNTGKSIVPVRIFGAFEVFPRHIDRPRLYDWKRHRRYSLRLVYGKPIDPKEKSIDEIIKLVLERIESMR